MYKKSVALAAAAACVIATHGAAFAYQTSTTVSGDDTFNSLSGISNVTKLPGQDYGYSTYSYSKSANSAAEAIDARLSSFLVDNSSVTTPTSTAKCDSGSGQTNAYPIKISSDKTVFAGGLVRSAVPQTTDWAYTYCNSAVFRYANSPYATVDGTRITGHWDAIRLSSNSANFTVKNVWSTGGRDDFIENDLYYAGGLYDNLVDGTFQFISMQGDTTTCCTSRVVTVRGNVVRLKDMLYRGSQRWGAILKADSSAAKMDFSNNVIAIDARSTSTNLSADNWKQTWSKMSSCSNNLLLWMGDHAMPSSIGSVKSCFTVLKGAAARAKWAEVKQNWINCHPLVRRESTDPVSRTGECRANTFGGYTS